MKVLILTAKFGMGHLSASNSIKESIIRYNKDADVKVVDLYEYVMPHLSNSIYKTFSFMIKYTKKIYSNFYLENDKPKDADLFCKFLNRGLEKLIEKEEPEMIISTFPIISKTVGYYKEKNKSKIKLITCITDISSHYEWIDRFTDVYMVPCVEIKRELIKKGINPNLIVVYGIPVSTKYIDNRARLSNRLTRTKIVSLSKYRADKEVLIMGGGLGVLPKEQKFYERLHAIKNTHFTILTGENKSLYDMIYGKYDNITVLGYTNEVAKFMERADCVITKPGGITVFEAIYSLTPIISFSTSLPNEVRNINFIIDNNFGIALNGSPDVSIDRIERFINSNHVLNSMKVSMNKFVKNLENDYFNYISEDEEKCIIEK